MVKGFQKEDIIVMTTDGLTNLVTQEDIYKLTEKNIEQGAKDLVELANKNGGYDNITVIIIKNI